MVKQDPAIDLEFLGNEMSRFNALISGNLDSQFNPRFVTSGQFEAKIVERNDQAERRKPDLC
jgi:hypothetical protein